MEFPPHSGYHWQGQNPFFEGWYCRLLLPDSGESFAFMYSIENPGGDRPYSGGAVQILGPGSNGEKDELLCRTFPSVQNFWASPTQFALGHWGKNSSSLPPQPLDPQDFFSTVNEGYQIHGHHHQGRIRVANQQCRWHFTVERPNNLGG